MSESRYGQPGDEPYINAAFQRLTAEGFECRENVPYEDVTLRAFATRKTWRVTKYGSFFEAVIFKRYDALDPNTLRRFADGSLYIAVEAGSTGPLRGWGLVVACYPVAIVEAADPASVQAVRFNKPGRGTAAFAIPVLYERARGAVHYFETTPVWGAVYYRGFRRMIERNLVPAASAVAATAGAHSWCAQSGP